MYDAARKNSGAKRCVAVQSINHRCSCWYIQKEVTILAVIIWEEHLRKEHPRNTCHTPWRYRLRCSSAALTGVLQRTAALHQGPHLGDLLRGAQVDQLDVHAPAGGEHDVVRLQVQVGHAAPVQVLQAVQHLQRRRAVRRVRQKRVQTSEKGCHLDSHLIARSREFMYLWLVGYSVSVCVAVT